MNKEEVLKEMLPYFSIEYGNASAMYGIGRDSKRAIEEARAQGDLSENAEYSAAKEMQGRLEDRIKEIEYTLEHATIIEGSNDGKVCVGSVITVKYDDDDEEEEYTIVGTNEADPFSNKISNESPIAKAVMGKKVNDKVTVESPNGSFDIEIVKVA